jgi:hypothetical protein
MVLVLTLAAMPSFAAPIQGQLTITGDATVGAAFIDFLCNSAITPTCMGTNGNFRLQSAVVNTGDFAPLANTTGQIKDLSQAAQPVGTTFLLMDFITFTANADMRLDLRSIAVGVGGQAECAAAPAPGQTCTPLLPGNGPGPINLQNTLDTFTGQLNSSASFTVGGTTRRDSTGETSPFTGIFTAQFPGVPYQVLLQQLSDNGTITSGYTGSFIATIIPEPSTPMLLLGGLLVFAGALRRRRK